MTPAGDLPARAQRVTPELVVRELRRHNFAVLSTAGAQGKPDSAGVNYGVSGPGDDLAIYVMTRRHLRKARDIARDPRVSMVVPLARRLLWFLPPPTMQLEGRAVILDWTDRAGIEVFERFWMGRRILDAYREMAHRGETRICFLQITVEPIVRTYMLASNVWELRTRMESGAAKVVLRHRAKAETRAERPSGRTPFGPIDAARPEEH